MMLLNYDRYVKARVPKSNMTAAKSIEGGMLMEDIIGNLKKHPRTADDAISQAKSAAVEGFNPYLYLTKLWKESCKKVVKAFKHEFNKTKDNEEKIRFSANFIKNGIFQPPADDILVFGIHIYMQAKKGALARLFTGAMGKWGEIGVGTMTKLVESFAGSQFSKQVNKKTVFNAVGEKDNVGKVSYYFCMKMPRA